GPAISRQLQQLSYLPLRRETIYHLALNAVAAAPPSLNRLIAADPALALAALRSTPRCFRDSQPSIPQIARFITRQAILDLVKLSQEPTSNCPPGHHPAIERVWTHAIATAHAARQLSRTWGYAHPQTAFLAGLLHNLGLLALVAVAPDMVQDFLQS